MRHAPAVVLTALAIALTAAPHGYADDGVDDDDAIRDERPEQGTIDEAVNRGVAWLKEEQKRDGTFGQGPGETALCLLALRHSGVPEDDRVCKRAAMRLEAELPDGTVYGAAIGALALIAQHPERHESKIRELVSDLQLAQCKNGQWSYGYRTGKPKPAGDNSNSQFALLALASARAKGFDVSDEPFANSRTFLVATQNEDGGYGYSDKERSRSYAAMTAGGAMCLALAVSVDRGEPAGRETVIDDPAVSKTLGWLGENFDPEKNTGAAAAFGGKKGKRSDNFWRHYWLWSVERVGAATGVTKLGEVDWYGAGANVLLERQLDKGQWRDPEKELIATCFALLFFRRSTWQAITPRDVVPPTVTPSGENAPKRDGGEAGDDPAGDRDDD